MHNTYRQAEAFDEGGGIQHREHDPPNPTTVPASYSTLPLILLILLPVAPVVREPGQWVDD